MYLHQICPGKRHLLDRRPKVADVAARAGVSTATVDRVINGRGGVHQKTVARVEEAIREIAGGRSPALDPAHRFDVVLSGERGGGTKALADAFALAAEDAGANVEISFVETMNPEALAERLRACAQRGSSGVAVQCSIMRSCAKRSRSLRVRKFPWSRF